MHSASGESAAIWPLLLFFFAVVGLVVLMLLMAYAFGEHRDHRRVKYPFESGILPIGRARFRISVQFYMVAMFFVLFDLETVFILAWAVAFREVGWAGYGMALIFMAELVAGLIYIWKLGALDWAPREGRAAIPATTFSGTH